MDIIDDNTLYDLAEAFVVEIILAWAILADDGMLDRALQPYIPSTGLRSMYTDSSRGERWIAELLTGHPARIRNVTHMSLDTFEYIVNVCREQGGLNDDTVYGARHGEVAISIAQRVLIFSMIVAQDMPYRMVAEVTSHSLSTISRVFHEVLYILAGLHSEYVVDPTTEVPELIAESRKYVFFEGCVGAIDGTHIPISVSQSIQNSKAYFNRKGWTSQNVLAACDFNGNFTYVLPGWEGSAHDGKVFRDARARGWRAPAPGYYFLADAGYTNTDMTMVPYRNVRYHLKEWEKSAEGPQNAKELFNLQHAKLRNAIERAFGILKARFPILCVQQRGFSVETQVKLVLALTALYNIINSRNCVELENETLTIDDAESAYRAAGDELGAQDELIFGDIAMAQRRDELAELMWEDRNRILAERELSVD